MNKYLLGAALLAATAVVAPANATVSVIAVPSGGGSVDFGQSNGSAGAITDEFQFTVPTPGDASGSIVSIDLSGLFDVTITSVLLDSTPFTQSSTGQLELWTLVNTAISAGPHSIFVTGTWGTNGGAYSGTLNYSPNAVPEPASWALMIGGLGLVGGAMRRARKTTKVVFA